MRTRKWDLRGGVVPVGLIVLAEIAGRVSGAQGDSVAPPSSVLVAWARALFDGALLSATIATMACAIAGLAIGFTLGLVMGTLTGMFRRLDHLLEVTVEIVRPIPSVALIPIALLIFGFGYRMELSIVAFSTFWPALILSRAAISGVEPRLFEVARALQLGLAARVTKIVIPAALPRIFVALRLSLGVSLIVAVTVEIASNTIGLGYRMMEAGQSLHPADMLAFLFWIGVLGWATNVLMLVLQTRLFPAFSGGARP